MTDSHLTNTVAYLRRQGEKKRELESLKMLVYPSPRGDMACMVFERELMELATMGIDTYLEDRVVTFAAMVSECDRRGIGD